MPELPEVEVVRRGLARWLPGQRIEDVQVHHPRPVRRHAPGARDFADRLRGAQVLAVVRRGKYLWCTLDTDEALLAHLGMSGQLLLQPTDAAAEPHLRVHLQLPQARQLRFVDQRMFGWVSLAALVATTDGLPGGWTGPRFPGEPQPEDESAPTPPPTGAGPALVPEPVAHVARDALDPHLDLTALISRLRMRRTGIKRALLDQTLVSGVGNIYADEALWQARVHYARATDTLPVATARRVLLAVQDVMRRALLVGGTSFDRLYVDVNGRSGYFDRSLAVYGQHGRACPRCGATVVREAFMNRSAHRCPRCQPRPRGEHARG